MAETLIARILRAHSDEEVAIGKVVWVTAEIRNVCDLRGAEVIKIFEKEYPGGELESPGGTVFTLDHMAPANNFFSANNQQVCRAFARARGAVLHDVDAGIGPHLLLEEGRVGPGEIAVGLDANLNLIGAVGALGLGLGPQDVAFALRTGKIWMEVPTAIRVVLDGELGLPATAKDLALALGRELGHERPHHAVLEVEGPLVDRMTMDQRITLSSMAASLGVLAILMVPSPAVLSWLERRCPGRKWNVSRMEEGAGYAKTLRLDATRLRPLVALPPVPGKTGPVRVVDVSEIQGKPISSVFLGSCTNGRGEDFAQAARVLKGKKVAPGVVFTAVPATREVYGQLLAEGVLSELFSAGVVISAPGCGGCLAGQVGVTGRGEVELSTGNRNYRGKQGEGEIYLVSPLTAAVSALTGRITSPDQI